MRIEEGKTYLDEYGKKAGPLTGNTFKYILGRERGNDPEWDNSGVIRIKGEEGYGNLVSEWTEGPIRTETVTVRRLEPGVYGVLGIAGENEKSVRIGFARVMGDGQYFWATPTELRELARVALEIAEYLENVD